MSGVVLNFPDGIYAVDQEIIFSIYRSNANAKAKIRSDVSYERVVEDDWFGPPIISWGVDWGKLKSVVDQSTVWHASLKFIEKAEKIGMRTQKAELRRVLMETRNAGEVFRNFSNHAMRKTMQRIEKNVKFGETGVTVAKFVRDTSVTGLGIGITILSGGSAAGLVGAAGGKGLLDGAVTLQDTGGDFKAAGFKAGTSFAVNLIPTGKSGGGKVIMWVVKSGADSGAAGAQALVEGKTVEEAWRASAEKLVANVAGAGLDAIANQKKVKEMLAKAVMPVTIKIDYTRVSRFTGDLAIQTPNTLKDAAGVAKSAASVAADGLTGFPKKTASKAIGGAVANSIFKPPPAVPRNPRGKFLQTGSLYGAHLLEAAIQGPLTNYKSGSVPTYTQWKNMIIRRLNDKYVG